MRARSSVRARAPGMVPQAAGRLGAIRGEPAEEVPGYLSLLVRVRRLAGALGGAEERVRVLDRPGRAHLPGRQPAYEAVRVLGMADRRGPPRAPRSDLPCRSAIPRTRTASYA